MTAPLATARLPREKAIDYADRMRRLAEARGIELRQLAAELDRVRAEAPPVAAPMLAQVLDHHRERLRELAAEQYTDGRFVTGLVWALWAIDRIAAAAGGCTDAKVLGLAERPSFWRGDHPPTERQPTIRPREAGTPVRAMRQYTLAVTDGPIGVDMPLGATLLSVGPSRLLGAHIEVFAIVDPEGATQRRRFHAVLNGFPLPVGVTARDYLGSCQVGPRVRHVFVEAGTGR